MTIANLRKYGDVRFRDGKAALGYNNCTMLPGGARPYYADFITEEPANSPATEDALVLVECGGDTTQQILLMIQLGNDQKTRSEHSSIQADIPPDFDRRMTFLSYSVDRGIVRTTVRTANGSTEQRRYRYDGGTRWVRM
ncbi:hypothetical protein [Micromonospora sp. 067-2]|uniref:hypothetical protein n=1 Tax=Micromonospora sp. 067-2 TaxID=2789270 RepID=UPI00397B4F8D